MAKTLGQVLSYIGEVMPNGIASTTIIGMINDERREIWEHLENTTWSAFYTVLDTPNNTLPTNITIDMIEENGVFVATSTLAPTSTTLYETYKFIGADETLVGNRYYDFRGDLGLYPVPDNVYPAMIKHKNYFNEFSSTDTNTQFTEDKDYVNIIIYKTIERILKSGNNPDVMLANNWAVDAKELESKMKVKQAKEKNKTPRMRFSYKEGW